MSFFQITHKEAHTLARTGVIHTDHGDIETPIFMPVGTQATVKTLATPDLLDMNAQIILGNTYHLHLRPGEELIAQFGGLHKFMNWNKPILTDSGGFQVFSLGQQKEGKERAKATTEAAADVQKQPKKLVEIDEEGVTFRSHIDGSKHRFTPESSIEIQHKLGADIIMAFDECTPDSATEEYAKKALERTHRWAIQSLEKHKELNEIRTSGLSGHPYKQFLFGIVQGAGHKQLREESARFISSLDFDGIAIGGESVGYNMEATKEILDWVNPFIPEDKPHYTMGLGHSPLDFFDVVEKGVDMFDCVSPTRMARNGSLYVSPPAKGELEGVKDKRSFTVNITRSQFREDKAPIDPSCDCYTCLHHSRAYLHHLFKAEELLAYRLATIHNVRFMLKLMEDMRAAIREDKFLELKQQWTG